MRRTPCGREGAFRFLHLLVFIVIVGTGACGRNPVSPTTTARTAVPPIAISISGTPILQRPGDTAQLEAVATFADGTTRSVTADAWWEVDPREIAFVRHGALTASAYGECYVLVTYGPVSARAPVRVVPNGMFLLSGRVTEASGLPLLQARVRIASSTDQLSTTTNLRGTYILPASGDTEVRADMDDFEPQIKHVTVARDEQLDFQLRLNCRGFGGTYRLIFSAAASCALPAEAMRRTYIARVAEAPSGALTVTLSGTEFVVWGEAGFTGRRDGSALRFDITDDYVSEYQFIEWLDGSRELALSGTATAAVGETFTALFNGAVVVRWRSGATVARCEAADHRLEFTR